MYAPVTKLKPLAAATLSPDESKILAWLRSTKWEPQKAAREPIPYKTKVPEFFGGIRLYHVQAHAGSTGSLGPLELFIKKLSVMGILTKQDLYPVTTEGTTRFLSLKKEDLDNLGVGKEEEEE